jgi:hypothetical protein
MQQSLQILAPLGLCVSHPFIEAFFPQSSQVKISPFKFDFKMVKDVSELVYKVCAKNPAENFRLL